MEKLRTIIVPTSKNAMEELNYGIEYDKVNRNDYLLWHLSEKEFSLLWDCGIFDSINSKCDTLIDDYEDECIEYEKLLIVKKTIIQYKKPFTELQKFGELVDIALMYATCIDFAF